MKKIAVITGASSGMGRRFAETVQEFGTYDEIWAIARRVDRLEELKNHTAFPVRTISLDLSDPASYDTYAALLREEQPEVGLLINASGFGKFRAVMDTPALQPIGGMQALMMRPTEVELVRECFRWLFNDDDGDLKKRQGRVEMFADQVNGRFRRCLPRMAKFTQTAGSAALYLSLLEPEDNYFFVPAEAKAWAAYFGYDEDFGTGAAFNLTQYYAMCDDLLNELPKYDELTRLHTERLKNTMHGINDQLHLLVYDIMHSAYVNGYYPKGFSRMATAKERTKAVKQKAERADLCMQIAEKEQKLQELLASPTALPDLTGCKVTHKMFGVGKVLPSTDQFLVIDFNGQQKKFSTTTSMTSGYLTASDPAVMEQMQDYQAYTKEKDQLEKELKTMKSNLLNMG